jgi:hypothetical protein
MRISLKIAGRQLSLAVNEPEPEPKEPEHKCPTREEDFESWKARSSSGTASFGFAPKSQDFVNNGRYGNKGGRWTT